MRRSRDNFRHLLRGLGVKREISARTGNLGETYSVDVHFCRQTEGASLSDGAYIRIKVARYRSGDKLQPVFCNQAGERANLLVLRQQTRSFQVLYPCILPQHH